MSLITLHLVDGDGKPVKNATVTWLRGGKPFNTVRVPSNTGVIYLDSNDDSELLADGVRVRGTAFGYTTTETDALNLARYGDFTFTMPANGLGTAVAVGAGLGALLFFTAGKKKKISGFDKLPPAAQTGIVFGGLGLIAYFLFFNKKPAGAALVSAAAAALDGLSLQGILPTISNAQAEAFASSLRAAFDDCGTDEATVMTVMQRMYGAADVWLLIYTYGTRPYKGCFDGDFFGDHSYNLSEAINKELSAYWVNAINNQFATNGIDFKF